MALLVKKNLVKLKEMFCIKIFLIIECKMRYFVSVTKFSGASQVALVVKNPPAEDSWRRAWQPTAVYWRIQWMEESGRQWESMGSMGLQRPGHD